MSRTVCLWANSLIYPEGGGQLWVYLNWALGLRSCGCEVIWLDLLPRSKPPEETQAAVARLKRHLQPYGLADKVALHVKKDRPLPEEIAGEVLDFDAALAADLLLNMSYAGMARRWDLVGRFRRTAFIDIDPGLTQVWIAGGQMSIAPHDLYVTIGETVGRPDALFPDCGLAWIHTPPCVALDRWPVCPAPSSAPYTTVTHWSGVEWVAHGDQSYSNNKRDGFLPCLDLPRHVAVRLELALRLAEDEAEERADLEARGWSVQDSRRLAATPSDYQAYIQRSRGEFSCVKPSCVRLQNAWISDRTLCYLASGKPAIVEHTGPSRFLPDAEGLLRFRTLKEAAARLAEAEADYDRHCRAARALAEEYFDAAKVVGRVLDYCL